MYAQALIYHLVKLSNTSSTIHVTGYVEYSFEKSNWKGH